MVRNGDQDGIAVILHLRDARKIGGDLIAAADVAMWDTALRRHLEQDRGLSRDEANDWMAALTARVAELARETDRE